MGHFVIVSYLIVVFGVCKTALKFRIYVYTVQFEWPATHEFLSIAF